MDGGTDENGGGCSGAYCPSGISVWIASKWQLFDTRGGTQNGFTSMEAAEKFKSFHVKIRRPFYGVSNLISSKQSLQKQRQQQELKITTPIKPKNSSTIVAARIHVVHIVNLHTRGILSTNTTRVTKSDVKISEPQHFTLHEVWIRTCEHALIDDAVSADQHGIAGHHHPAGGNHEDVTGNKKLRWDAFTHWKHETIRDERRSTGGRGVQSVAFPCVNRASRPHCTATCGRVRYILTYMMGTAEQQRRRRAKVWCLRVHRQMPARACDVMLLFCGILLEFVRPSCKSIYRIYITKQANN